MTERLGWHSLGTVFDCVCGERHALPIETCYIGEEAAARLASFARGRCGTRGLLVADENTHAAGGEAVGRALCDAGKQITERIYAAAGLEATEERAQEVARCGVEADFYVAVGSGTVSDLAKAAGSEQGKPVLLFPTAASMNGYSSGITALKVRGLKRTLPCRPATGIFADPVVAATAPQRMTAAGVADFLSKCSSASDWHASHLLRGAYYCHRPREFNEGIQEQLLEKAPAIGRGEADAVRFVLEAMLLSGFGMVVAGSSAPASGGEHLISHYLDMKHGLYGTPCDLHGAQVGVGTLHTLRLWEAILGTEPSDIDIDACVAAQLSEEMVEGWIMEDWGTEVGAEVLGQWRQKRLDDVALRAELAAVLQRLPELRTQLAGDLLSSAVVEQCIRESGGAVSPEALSAPVEEYLRATVRARYLRNRFTVLDLAAELRLA